MWKYIGLIHDRVCGRFTPQLAKCDNQDIYVVSFCGTLALVVRIRCSELTTYGGGGTQCFIMSIKNEGRTPIMEQKERPVGYLALIL